MDVPEEVGRVGVGEQVAPVEGFEDGGGKRDDASMAPFRFFEAFGVAYVVSADVDDVILPVDVFSFEAADFAEAEAAEGCEEDAGTDAGIVGLDLDEE